MMHTFRKISISLAAVVAAVSVITTLPSPARASGTKPLSPPIFTSKSVAKAKAHTPFAFTVKTKANPTASIAVGPLPPGLSFADNGNGTATLSGTFPFAETQTISLTATNTQGSTPQTLSVVVKGLPGIRHVFVITLENKGYNETFGTPANDPYLASTLPSQGALLKNYYGIGHFSNDNYIGLISGQPPNSSTQADCFGYANFPAGDGLINGIQQGAGCVYPSNVPSLPSQLASAGFSWKGYLEDMGNDPSRESATCGHPVVGASDPSFVATSTDGYATRHNPFVYFHSIIDNTAVCNSQVVPLGTTGGTLPAGTPAGVTGLATDLQSVSTTPNFSVISPNLCNDGHDYPCKNPTGTSALANIDTFLSTWVPLIENSPAFKQDGLLEITFDEAEAVGSATDATACCGETPGPAANSGGNGFTGPGGGKVGTVLISPFITPGAVVAKKYNHYSSLASIEDLFGLPHLGEAATVTSNFDKGIFHN
jgi:hypothetical protein